MAIPALSRRHRHIVEELHQFGIAVLQLPSVEEITSGPARIDVLRPIPIEERLGRDVVPPEELWPLIEALEAAIERQDADAALGVLVGLVPEWRRGGKPEFSVVSLGAQACSQELVDAAVPPAQPIHSLLQALLSIWLATPTRW